MIQRPNIFNIIFSKLVHNFKTVPVKIPTEIGKVFLKFVEIQGIGIYKKLMLKRKKLRDLLFVQEKKKP